MGWKSADPRRRRKGCEAPGGPTPQPPTQQKMGRVQNFNNTGNAKTGREQSGRKTFFNYYNTQNSKYKVTDVEKTRLVENKLTVGQMRLRVS